MPDIVRWAKSLLGTAPSGGGEGSPRKADKTGLKRVCAFFHNRVKAGEKWPTDEWRESLETYTGPRDKARRGRANLYRTKLDTQSAFLSRDPLQVQFSPQDGYEHDAFAKALADCEEDVYRYLFREQGFGRTIARMRWSVGVRNIGAVWHTVDKRKMLPGLRYLNPKTQLAVDPDAGGDLSQAAWVAVAEFIAPSVLSRMPSVKQAGIKRADLDKAAQAQADLLEAENGTQAAVERLDAMEAVAPADRKCKVWHVYARNHVALHDAAPEEAENPKEGAPHLERFRDERGMREPRRYVMFVENYRERVVIDNDFWPEPVDYDYNEWPVTLLRYNEDDETVAGFTDVRHEQVLLDDHETSLKDLNTRDRVRNPPKFLKSSGCSLSDARIRELLESDDVECFPDGLTADGKVALQMVDWGTLAEADMKRPEQLRDLYYMVSMVPEVMRGEEMETKRTATEVQQVTDAATAKLEARLKAYQEAQAEIARKVIQTAHAILPKHSRIEVMEPVTVQVQDEMGQPLFDEMTGEPVREVVAMEPRLYGEPPMPPLPWVGDEMTPGARDLLKQPGAELVYLGVDAMVGDEKAQAWEDELPLEIVRRSVKVSVEQGSTNARQAAEKIGQFAEIWQNFLGPVIQQLEQAGLFGKTLELKAQAARKAMELMRLDEFEELVPDDQQIQELAAQAMAQQQQAAEAEMQAAMGGGPPR